MSSEYNLSYPFSNSSKTSPPGLFIYFNDLNKNKLSMNIIKYICA